MTKLQEIVYNAAKVLPTDPLIDNVQQKDGLKNIVTVYDLEVQEFLVKSIRENYKNCSFISEENIHQKYEGDKALFIIDPIDGTTNFYNNCKFSSISVAMYHNDDVVESVIYNPYLDEMFHAEKGKGAWVNDKKIKINDVTLSNSIIGYTNCPYDKELFETSFEFGKLLLSHSLDFRRMGSSALEICYAAMGRYQLYCELVLYPWDYMAASLFVREAGGVITDLDGNNLSMEKRCSVLAGCPTAHHEVLKLYKQFSETGKHNTKFNTKLFN